MKSAVKGLSVGIGIFLTVVPDGLKFLRAKWMLRLPNSHSANVAAPILNWSALGAVYNG